MSRREPLLCIFAVAGSLLVDEIMLSAVFNVLIGAFSTVLAISVALLGLSAAGIVVYVYRRSEAKDVAPEAIYRAMGIYVIATVLAAAALMSLPVSHADFSYAPSVSTSVWRLTAYLIAIAPFFAGGICINLLLIREARTIGRIYAFDLAGSASGCLIAVVLLGPLDAPEAMVLATLPVALLASWSTYRRRPRRPGLMATPFVVLFALAIDALGHPIFDVKRLNTLGEVDRVSFRGFSASSRDLDYERWALDAWTIIRKDEIPQQWENFRGWGLSDRFEGFVPRLKLVNYNQRFSTYVTEFDGGFEEIGPWLDADLISLHHLLGRSYPKVLNVGAGGGREVLNALHHGAEHVTAVDISEVTVERIMKGSLEDFSGGLYRDPRVLAIADEGRSFVLRSPDSYDLIDFTIVGGTNLEKLDIMRVDDLFTREALATYVSKLREGGVLSYVMYNTRAEILEDLRSHDEPVLPYIPAVKTLAGIREVFESRFPERKFSDHVLVASLPGVMDKNYDLVHIIVSTTPFLSRERARFVESCRRLAFGLLHPADRASLYSDIATVGSVARLEESLPFDIGPTTDDKPFHYSFKADRIDTAGQWFRVLAANPLMASGAVLLAIAVVFLFGPLGWVRDRRGGGAFSPGLILILLYFALIGVAYMLVEVSFIMKLGLYLGKPVLALSVALSSFLLASGAGSALSSRLTPLRRVHPIALASAVAAYGMLLMSAWPTIQTESMAMGSVERSIIAGSAIAPLALLMGMFLPIGIRLSLPRHADLIPWLWAINGCLSVVGIFGCRILALFWGFNLPLVLGLACYLLTAVLGVAFLVRSGGGGLRREGREGLSRVG